jgi:hypothetical protein
MAEHQGSAAAVGTDLSLCGIRQLPFCISGAPVPPPRPGPVLSIHTVEVLGEVGNDAEAIATRTAAGAPPCLRTMFRGQYT